MLPHRQSLVYLDIRGKSNSLGHVVFHIHRAFPHESVKTSKVQSPQQHPNVLSDYKKGVHIFSYTLFASMMLGHWVKDCCADHLLQNKHSRDPGKTAMKVSH